MTTCKIEDCDRAKRGMKGFCSRHYKEWARANGPWCAVEDCNEGRISRGYCEAHYKLFLAHGVPAKKDYSDSTERRFWKYVVKGATDDDCWGWTAAILSTGYGELRLGAYEGSKLDKAHRISWTLHNGPIPEATEVKHRCESKSCSNPKHLFLKPKR